MNADEFGARKLFKLKYRGGGGGEGQGGPNNTNFLQNWFPPEIRSPVFNLKKFEDSEKSTPQSCRMHEDLMNDDEFGSRKLLKLKYRRGGPNNSDILQNWFPPEIRSPLFNL